MTIRTFTKHDHKRVGEATKYVERLRHDLGPQTRHRHFAEDPSDVIDDQFYVIPVDDTEDSSGIGPSSNLIKIRGGTWTDAYVHFNDPYDPSDFTITSNEEAPAGGDITWVSGGGGTGTSADVSDPYFIDENSQIWARLYIPFESDSGASLNLYVKPWAWEPADSSEDTSDAIWHPLAEAFVDSSGITIINQKRQGGIITSRIGPLASIVVPSDIRYNTTNHSLEMQKHRLLVIAKEVVSDDSSGDSWFEIVEFEECP